MQSSRLDDLKQSDCLLFHSISTFLAAPRDLRIKTKVLFGERISTKACMNIQMTKVLNEELNQVLVNILDFAGPAACAAII